MIEIWLGGMGFAISLRQKIDADKDVSLRCRTSLRSVFFQFEDQFKKRRIR